METVARNVFEREDGGVLERLWRDLVRWLRPRIRCAATGMDIASETVHRAIRRFFFDRSQALPRVGWDDLWAWSVAVARTSMRRSTPSTPTACAPRSRPSPARKWTLRWI